MHQSGNTFLKLLVAIIAMSLALTAAADTGLGRHKKMYAVPVTKKVTIDGKLTDWDLSGQITMYVTSETSDMQSAKFAMMYDKDALYLSAVVRDPSPMMNRHDPKVDGDRGWDADACQFRLSIDPAMGYPINIGNGVGDVDNTNVVHMILWRYTDTQQPVLQMDASMRHKPLRPEWAPFGVAPPALFQAKYLLAEDKGGYTFEYRIPWSTLGAKRPLKSGDLVASTVQFNWSQPDGLKTAGGSAWCYDVMAGSGFPFQSTACWGKLIISANGNLPKEMVEGDTPPVKPLPLKFTYTLPEDSQITVQVMDKNNYVRRILVAQGDRRAGKNVELWDGMDDQGVPLPAGDYTWKGIYHQPITQKYLFSPHNSAPISYSTDDGTGGWGGDHGTPQDACAFDTGVILSWEACEAGKGIIRTDLTGKKLWGSMNCATYLATDGKRLFTAGDLGFNSFTGVKVFDLADSRPLNFGNGTPELHAPAGGDGKSDTVTGIAYADGIVYVAYCGRNLVGLFDAQSGDPKGAWQVPAPGRMAARPGGGLAVISGDTIVAVKDGTVTPLAATHLDKPQGIAVGPDGALYVANAGALQNISVFDTAGQYQRSIGMAGGRPAKGRYNPNGILEPGGITLDKNGHLWVAERLDFPKRVSVWDAKTGAFVNEFFGSSTYFGYSYIDPKQPDEIYCHNVLWKIDWKNNTCSPVSTIWRPTTPNMMKALGVAGYIEHPRFFTAKNGKQYAHGTSGPFVSIISVRDGDVYKPFAGFISILRDNSYFGTIVPFPVMEDKEKYPDGTRYFWQDANDDQSVQAEELVRAPEKYGPWVGFITVDGDLNTWIGEGYMAPVSIDAAGRARYDLTKIEASPAVVKSKAGPSFFDPADGGYFTGFSKYSADGSLLWVFPGNRHWADCLAFPLQGPGKLWGLTNELGVAGNFIGMACYFGTYHVVTTDGIYVCALMRDYRDGKGLGPDCTASEVSTGQLVKPDGMNRYFLLAGAADARVTEIFGLDTIKPLPGGLFTMSAADVKTAADALAEYNTRLAKSKRLSIVREKKALANAEAITKAFDPARSFTAHAAYDDTNLYLAFNVTSPYELVNSAPDPQVLFKGGNCLDIQLATDPNADPKRKTPAPGDVRLLITRRDGKSFAVIYRPKVKGFKGEPIMLKSPANKESFDAIEVTDKIGLEYAKTAGGYTATVTIPQAALGLALRPGQQVKMDLGILYGNATGNQISARSYWMNNSFSANVTNDVPNESRLEPAEWGTVVVE